MKFRVATMHSKFQIEWVKTNNKSSIQNEIETDICFY